MISPNFGIIDILVLLPFYLALHAGFYGIFKKSGKNPWMAFVPFYSSYIWLEIVGRPKHWMIWMCLPVINMVASVSLIVDTMRSFNRESFWEHFLAVLFPFAVLPWVGFSKDIQYAGAYVTRHKAEPEKYKRSQGREWADSILFAGSAAMIIRSLMFELYVIPTTSMESTMKAGDFVLVSKFHYGVRLPSIPLAMPFLHNSIPFLGTKSYLDWIVFPYKRLPGLVDVKRNDVVVFNYPADDIYADPDGPGLNKETAVKQNYVKRCVGVAGDTLHMKLGKLYVNGLPGWEYQDLQNQWQIRTESGSVSGYMAKKFEEMGFRFEPNLQHPTVRNANIFPDGRAFLPERLLSQVSAVPGVTGVEPMIEMPYDSIPDSLRIQYLSYLKQYPEEAQMYPKRPDVFPWNVDNFGPLWVPRKGGTIKLNAENILKYRRVIEVYEGHTFEIRDNAVLIDGSLADSYTFTQNYFFMMGDNRHQSLDSRYWGFVPETHILGKPILILLSWEGGPRWNRFFLPTSKLEQ